MQWVTNKTNPTDDGNIPVVPTGMLPGQYTRVEGQTGRCAWTGPEQQRYLQSIYH